MASEIKPGDVVRLKSGGPQMTVEKVDDYLGIRGALCVWFDGNSRVESIFALVTLDVV